MLESFASGLSALSPTHGPRGNLLACAATR